MDLFHKQKQYSAEVSVPCKIGRGCSHIASYKPQTKWFSSEILYCLDEADHFCACLTQTKNGEEKTSQRFIVIKVGREIVDEAKIGATLEEVRKSKLSKEIVKKLMNGKESYKSYEEFKQDIERGSEKLSKKLEPILSGTEYPSYIMYSNFRGEFKGIVPFTPESFEKLRAIGRDYINVISKSM